MNIFAVHIIPQIAAIQLVDRHVVKMITESAQILSNCFTLEQLASPDCPRTQKGTPRKHSYPHHPCCKWVNESRSNMSWVIEHAIALEEERIYRFESDTPHFSIAFVKWAKEHRDESISLNANRTPFAQAMPPEYKRINWVEAYRKYYAIGKKHLHQWTKRGAPEWITSYE